MQGHIPVQGVSATSPVPVPHQVFRPLIVQSLECTPPQTDAEGILH